MSALYSRHRSVFAISAMAGALVLLGMAPGWGRKAEVSLEVSTTSATLRILGPALPSGAPRTFPVGIGRFEASRRELYTPNDPTDPAFYAPRRQQPAYHRGHAFIRLLPRHLAHARRGRADYGRAVLSTWSIHGPVTPTLIWGPVSAGCIRMRPRDLQVVFRIARRFPGMALRFTKRAHGFQAKHARCPSPQLTIRRLRRLPLHRVRHDISCGVDHWYSVALQGGDRIAVTLEHSGGLQVELFGIRAISAIARGQYGFVHRLPSARRSRGMRYIRVVAAGARRVERYALRVERLR